MKFIPISTTIMQHYSILTVIIVLHVSILRFGIDASVGVWCVFPTPYTIGSTIQVNNQTSIVRIPIRNSCINDTSQLSNGLFLRFEGTGERLVARVVNSNSGTNSSASCSLYFAIFEGSICPPWTCVTSSNSTCQREGLIFDTMIHYVYTIFVAVQEGIYDLSIIPIANVTNATKTPSIAPNMPPIKTPTSLAPVPVPVKVPSNVVVTTPLAVPTPVIVPVSSPVKDDVPVPVPISSPTPAFVPIPVPVKIPSNDVPSKCGIFGKSLFCPFTLNGIIGRFIRRLFSF